MFFGVERKDDSGRKITGLLPFFISLSFFLSGTLVFLINDTSIKQEYILKVNSNKIKDKTVRKLSLPIKPKSQKSSKYISFDSWVHFGALILVMSFLFTMLRREGQASVLVDLVGAWNKIDIDNSEEILVKHGLSFPEDRLWITDIIKIRHKFTEDKKEIPNDKETSSLPRSFTEKEAH